METARLALLTTHFGKPFWVALLLQRMARAFPELPLEHMYVIDQDRTESSAERLRTVLGPVQVLRYPRSQPYFAMTAHDHAHVLNLAVREIDCDVLMVFDSDAHPVGAGVRQAIDRLLERSDAVLAANGRTGSQTHPCFMVFGPAIDRDQLFFDAGQLDKATDTGREIYGQVRAMGLEAELLRPEPAFAGLWGTFYLDGAIYHHGSGSFDSSPDPRLLRQSATWRREERFFRRKVSRGVYDITSVESGAVRAWRRLKRARTRLASALRRRLIRPQA